MPGNRKFDTPGWAIEAGQKIQDLPGDIVRGMINAAAGSSYPSYAQARWHTAVEVISSASDEEVELPIAEADPDASVITSVIPRLKNKAVVVESGSRLPDIRNSVKAMARVAIAYTYKDVTHVGDLPGEISSVFTSSPRIYRAALRTGRNKFGAGIGVWVPDEEVFILPEDCKISENNVPLEALAIRYPGIRLF